MSKIGILRHLFIDIYIKHNLRIVRYRPNEHDQEIIRMTNTSIFFLLNLVGGIAILGSNSAGLYLYPDQRTALWGGIAGNWRILFISSMFSSTGGNLIFCYTMRRALVG